MMRKIINAGFISLISVLFTFGQTSEGGAKSTVVSGDVVSVADGKITIKTAAGQIDAVLSDKTEVKKVLPDNPSFKAATAAAVSDIASGDRIAVTGVLAADGRSIPARAVYLMNKSDIAQKHAKESEEWRTRGITGRVAS